MGIEWQVDSGYAILATKQTNEHLGSVLGVVKRRARIAFGRLHIARSVQKERRTKN